MRALRSHTVVGIDVGGAKKGFHAVALEKGQFRAKKACSDPVELAAWCVETMRAEMIAVDAPCRWSSSAKARLAEIELLRQRIWCFSTPAREKAEKHTKNYYGWMLCGEMLYQALERSHRLCMKMPLKAPCCFETFPHAITWHLLGNHASAKKKRTQRREVLQVEGVVLDELTNIDWVDAALCALTAHKAASGRKLKAFGDGKTGLIIVPLKS